MSVTNVTALFAKNKCECIKVSGCHHLSYNESRNKHIFRNCSKSELKGDIVISSGSDHRCRHHPESHVNSSFVTPRRPLSVAEERNIAFSASSRPFCDTAVASTTANSANRRHLMTNSQTSSAVLRLSETAIIRASSSDGPHRVNSNSWSDCFRPSSHKLSSFWWKQRMTRCRQRVYDDCGEIVATISTSLGSSRCSEVFDVRLCILQP